MTTVISQYKSRLERAGPSLGPGRPGRPGTALTMTLEAVNNHWRRDSEQSKNNLHYKAPH